MHSTETRTRPQVDVQEGVRKKRAGNGGNLQKPCKPQNPNLFDYKLPNRVVANANWFENLIETRPKTWDRLSLFPCFQPGGSSRDQENFCEVTTSMNCFGSQSVESAIGSRCMTMYMWLYVPMRLKKISCWRCQWQSATWLQHVP